MTTRYTDREALQAHIPHELNKRLIEDCKRQLKTKTAIVREILETHNIKHIKYNKDRGASRFSLYVYLPEKLKKALQDKAEKAEISLTYYVQQILESYYRRN